MALLKEDGSLDIERINDLPFEEYMNEMGTLTQEQVQEYVSKLPLDESNEPYQGVWVDYTMEDDIARGAVDIEEYLNNMRNELRHR